MEFPTTCQNYGTMPGTYSPIGKTAVPHWPRLEGLDGGGGPDRNVTTPRLMNSTEHR